MTSLAGYPYAELIFQLGRDGEIQGALPELAVGTTDLVIVSHGWHMDAADSQRLYAELIGNLALVDEGSFDAARRKVAVWGVFWPSDRFRDDLGLETRQALGGHAAAVGDDLDPAVLRQQAEGIAAFLGLDPAALAVQAGKAVGGGGDAIELADTLRAAVSQTGEADEQTRLDHHDLMKLPGDKLVSRLAWQSLVVPQAPAETGAAAGFDPEAGPAAGGQAQGFFSGMTAGVARLLNQIAYYELKKRAGLVGAQLGKLLDNDQALDGVKLHLVGHSFGGRLVTAAARASAQHSPASMTLLQAAFSHNSFGVDMDYGLFYQIPVGGFRDVVARQRVTGPIAITHTWNDTAVGLAYPAASRVSQTIAEGFGVSDGFGGADDVFGGLGANGALGLKDGEGSNIDYVEELTLRPGHITNIRCNAIREHNDVGRRECAKILHAAMMAG